MSQTSPVLHKPEKLPREAADLVSAHVAPGRQ